MRNLGKMDLGLERGALALSAYSPLWKRAYSDEAHLVFDALRIEGLRLHHIGSTSVPGLRAKPILDILGSVADLAQLDSKRSVFEQLGYEYKGEYGIPGRRFSVLYNLEKTVSFVHIHVFAEGHPAIQEHLAFRDRLRKDPAAFRAYEEKKVSLLDAGTRRESYTEAKAELIQSMLKPLSGQEKILALLGSSPGGGNTLSFLRESFPEAELVDLHEARIAPYRYGGGESDGFELLVKKMLAADRVVFATPVYWYAMSGPMKDFFDRFSDLLRGPLKPLGEQLAGKRVELLSTGSDERLPFGFEVPFVSTALYLGMDYMGAKYRQFP